MKRKGNYKKLLVNNGDRFGKLTVLKEVDEFIQPSGQSQRGFLCRCDCGNEKRVRLSHLNHGRVISCGCLIGEFHNESDTRLYNIWRGMKNRVMKYHSESHLYYDRGIKLYPVWRNSFIAFKSWALKNGYKEDLTIDRIDNDEGYYPDNCRFVPQYVNNANRRNTFFIQYNNQERPFTLVIREKGLKDHENTIRSRISRGWCHQKAIDTPIRKGNYKKPK